MWRKSGFGLKLHIKKSYCSQVAEKEIALCGTLQEDSKPIREDTLHSSFPAGEFMAAAFPMTASLPSCQEVEARSGSEQTRTGSAFIFKRSTLTPPLKRDWK